MGDEHFSKLRYDAGIPDDFINSGWSYNDLKAGGGKGGTLMVYLWGKYIVKELSKSDHRTLLEIAASYVNHLREATSLITKVFLHYKDVETGRKFFAMRNEVGNTPFKALYDLKGCADDKTLTKDGQSIDAVHKRIWNLNMWCGKCCWSKERQRYYKGKRDAANFEMGVTEKQRSQLFEALAYDCEWLASHRLMDYSLLVARKSEAPATQTYLRVRGDSGEEEILCISIIDFLQKWTCGKKVARALKVFECNKATVPPAYYAKRFNQHFRASIVISKAAEIVSKPAMELHEESRHKDRPVSPLREESGRSRDSGQWCRVFGAPHRCDHPSCRSLGPSTPPPHRPAISPITGLPTAVRNGQDRPAPFQGQRNKGPTIFERQAMVTSGIAYRRQQSEFKREAAQRNRQDPLSPHSNSSGTLERRAPVTVWL